MYPMLPRRLRLPLLYQVGALDGTVEPELRMLHEFPIRAGVAIDIGANVGLYAYRMSAIFSKVHAFEINDALTADLIAFNPGNVEVVHFGLSSQAGEAILYIPVLNGVSLTGWASLAPGNCPDTTEHVTKPVKIQTLDNFDINGVSFIKIDVEGHEVEVLNGGKRTLMENRPIVLVEIKTMNRAAVLEFFSEIDYVLWEPDNIMRSEASENHIFVPKPPHGAGHSNRIYSEACS